MPRQRISSVVVQQVWDDETVSYFKIETIFPKADPEDIAGVRLGFDDEDSIDLYAESWPEIRDQIDDAFDRIRREQEK